MKDNPAYTVQDRWVKMPMTEYINGDRDSGRVREYCRDCDRYGTSVPSLPNDSPSPPLPNAFAVPPLPAT